MQYFAKDQVTSQLSARKEKSGKSRVVLRLSATDTAWNPKRTKDFIEGPAWVKYETDDAGVVNAEVRE